MKPNGNYSYAAEKAVETVHVVRGGAKELTVDPFPASQRTDSGIAQAITQTHTACR
jgi:hypothetical protein